MSDNKFILNMSKYVRLPEEGYIVFVGDTHGDYITTKTIIKNYINRKDYYILMLGDYIDRGKDSQKNLDFLLKVYEEHKNIFLLAGNHEMHSIRRCSPSDFWDSLTEEKKAEYNKKLTSLPLVAVGNGFIALHGALPKISNLKEIQDIQNGDDNWTRIVWGDFRERRGEELGSFLGRPKFGKDYFETIMGNLKLNVLVRGHDPLAPERMFDNRCLTLFTSSSYKRERKIAISRLDKELKSIDDIKIVSFDTLEN